MQSKFCQLCIFRMQIGLLIFFIFLELVLCENRKLSYHKFLFVFVFNLELIWVWRKNQSCQLILPSIILCLTTQSQVNFRWTMWIHSTYVHCTIIHLSKLTLLQCPRDLLQMVQLVKRSKNKKKLFSSLKKKRWYLSLTPDIQSIMKRHEDTPYIGAIPLNYAAQLHLNLLSSAVFIHFLIISIFFFLIESESWPFSFCLDG